MVEPIKKYAQKASSDDTRKIFFISVIDPRRRSYDFVQPRNRSDSKIYFPSWYMNSNPLIPVDDPHGHREEFLIALGNEHLRSIEADGRTTELGADATYHLAVSLGLCRLYGVKLPEEVDGSLPSSIAIAAGKELHKRLSNAVEEAKQLPQSWDTAHDPAEANEHCLRLLRMRMNAWAALVSLDESYESAIVDRDPLANQLKQVIESGNTTLDAFDSILELREHLEILSTISGLALLDSWKQFLAPEYGDPLPWWLDGRLEAIAERIIKQARSTLPGPHVWNQVRQVAEEKPRGFPRKTIE